MQVIHDIDEWRTIRKAINKTIGFVPTMGNLHQGHFSLVEMAKAQSDVVVVSIFVNPTQFNQSSDFENYPRTYEADIQKLKNAGVSYCLMPDAKVIYADDYRYQVSEKCISVDDEGEFRPGHFDGVLTVVLKLLMLVQPDNSYFGEKDYQQYQLIKGMVEAFFLKTNVFAGETVRESSGLACSSRNNRLSSVQKKKAEKFAQIFHQKHLSISDIKQQLTDNDIVYDYVCKRDDRRFAAVHIDDIRLIDNYSLNHESASF